MPRIPDNMLNSVVCFYKTEEDALNGEKPQGTGFFVYIPGPNIEDFPNDNHVYLITNNHVMTNFPFLRIETLSGNPIAYKIQGDNCEPHPDGDDIAAASITDIDTTWRISSIIWPGEKTIRDWFQTINIGIGDEVFMLGRFVSRDKIQKKDTIARFGNISMMPGSKIEDGRNYKVEAFLVEMRSVGGSSGSPVFAYPTGYRENEAYVHPSWPVMGLLGVVTGHNTLYGKVVDRTKKGAPPVNEDWTVEHHTGMSIVSPAWKIDQIIMCKKFIKQREEMNAIWSEKKKE